MQAYYSQNYVTLSNIFGYLHKYSPIYIINLQVNICKHLCKYGIISIHIYACYHFGISMQIPYIYNMFLYSKYYNI